MGTEPSVARKATSDPVPIVPLRKRGEARSEKRAHGDKKKAAAAALCNR